MKMFKSISLFGTGLLLALAPLHAQPNTFSGGNNLNWASATDLQVMLQALESVPPVPYATLPRTARSGTFWSAQFAPGTRTSWPPIPGNFLGLDVWPMGDGHFLVDDRTVDYDQLQAAADELAAQEAAARLAAGGHGKMLS